MERRDHAASGYHLRELGDSKFAVAKGAPDIRGWQVGDAQGNLVGKVKELLCDTEALKVRYLIVDLAGNKLDLESRKVLIPIGLAEIHEAEDVITVPNLTVAHLQALPAYETNNLTPETERLVQRIFVGNHVHGIAPAPARQPGNPEYHRQERATQLLDSRKAPELDIKIEQTTPSAQADTQSQDRTAHSTSSPITDNQLQNNMQPVETGSTRLQSSTAEQQPEENMSLPGERILLERIPLDNTVNTANFNSFQEGTIELKEFGEMPIISKEAHVVEEITIGKDVEVHEEVIQEVSRRTEIQIEDLRDDSNGNARPLT